MKPLNHAITGTVTAMLLGVHLQEFPFVLAGIFIPHLNFHPSLKRDVTHNLVLWSTLLVVAMFLPSMTIHNLEIRPWVLCLGQVIHLTFDAFSNIGVPLYKTKRLTLGIYQDGEVVSEDSFVTFYTLAALVGWFIKVNH